MATCTIFVVKPLEQARTGRLIVATAAFILCISGVASSSYSFFPSVDEKPGSAVPGELSFYDDNGKAVSFSQLADRPAIVTLVYFSCSSFCPLLLGNLAETIEKTDRDRGEYRVITLSFDPTDTPQVAAEKKRNYVLAAGRGFPADSWIFLTGNRKNIERFTDAVGFRFRAENGGFSHPRAFIFLSRGGRVVRYLYSPAFTPFDVGTALAEASIKDSGISADNLILFCYSYDPGEKRYVFNTAKVLCVSVLVLAALLTLLILAMRSMGMNKWK